MKKTLTIVLMLAITLTGTAALAQTAFEEIAETHTYFHYSFCLYTGEYEFGDNTPFLPVEGHGYGSQYAAFRTQNGLFDAVFIPDKTGTGIQEIQLLASRNNVVYNSDHLTIAQTHTLGLLFPFSIEMLDNDTFGETLVTDIVDVAVQFNASNYSKPPIVIDGVGTVTPFVQGETFGICITFDTPVTDEFLTSRIWLLSNILEE